MVGHEAPGGGGGSAWCSRTALSPIGRKGRHEPHAPECTAMTAMTTWPRNTQRGAGSSLGLHPPPMPSTAKLKVAPPSLAKAIRDHDARAVAPALRSVSPEARSGSGEGFVPRVLLQLGAEAGLPELVQGGHLPRLASRPGQSPVAGHRRGQARNSPKPMVRVRRGTPVSCSRVPPPVKRITPSGRRPGVSHRPVPGLMVQVVTQGGRSTDAKRLEAYGFASPPLAGVPIETTVSATGFIHPRRRFFSTDT